MIEVLLRPAQQPLWVNLIVVAVTVLPLWYAGARLSDAGDTIGLRTRLGHGFAGLVLLSFATTLPDIASAATAGVIGDPQLAVASQFGSVAWLLAVLALADAALPGALTYYTPDPVELLEVVLLLLLLAASLVLFVNGELASIAHVGLGPVLLFFGYIGSLALLRQYEGRETWQVRGTPRQPESAKDESGDDSGGGEMSVRRAAAVFVVGGTVVLLAGIVATRSGSAIAEQSGLGSVFVGITLLTTLTNLPELGSAFTSVRAGRPRLAISHIVGSAMLNIALVAVVDLGFTDGPVLDELGVGALLVAALATLTVAVLAVGLVERKDRTVFRLGIDSLTVLLVYIGGAVLVYLRTRT